MRGVAGAQTDERPQQLADLAEVQARVKILDQTEDVTLCGAAWVPPTASLVRDQQDFACGPAVF